VLTGKVAVGRTFGAAAEAAPRRSDASRTEPIQDRSCPRTLVRSLTVLAGGAFHDPDHRRPHDRVDGRQKVTGEARYAAENNLPNIAYAVLVTSTIPAGSMPRSTRRRRQSAPGVINVISHLNAPKLPDTGGQQAGLECGGASPSCRSRTTPVPLPSARPVAAVVADTFDTPTHAAGLGRVTYRPTPARIVMAGTSGRCHKSRQGNALRAFSKGDAEGALAGAAVKVDQLYRIPYEHHNQMEPHALVAAWDGDRLTDHDSAQKHLHHAGQDAGQAFGVPTESVRVMSPGSSARIGSKARLGRTSSFAGHGPRAWSAAPSRSP